MKAKIQKLRLEKQAAKGKRKEIQKDKPGEYDTGYKIEVLENSVFYFLQSVFLIIQEKSVQLVVIHRNRLVSYDTYATIRGAKIAFTKLYNRKCWKDIQPQWTNRYPPLSEWMFKRMGIAGKGLRFQDAS